MNKDTFKSKEVIKHTDEQENISRVLLVNATILLKNLDVEEFDLSAQVDEDFKIKVTVSLEKVEGSE